MMIANKKQEVTNNLRELREQISNIDSKILEKQRLMHQIVGGDILHGADLKQYVNALREQSVIYKQYRSRLQGVNGELAIMNRTLDILQMLDPSLEQSILEYKKKTETQPTEIYDNVTKLKLECKRLTKEIDIKRAEFTQIREDLTTLRKTMEAFIETYNQDKDVFEEATYLVSEEVQKLKAKLSDTENTIKEKELSWKKLGMLIEKNEQVLVKLGEDKISASSLSKHSNFLNSLKEKYDELDSFKRELQSKMLHLEKQKVIVYLLC